jgi:hypothetical protein
LSAHYGSFARLAIDLVNTFWRAIEQLDPAQADLRVPEATYAAWRDGLVQRPDGTIRLNNEAVLGTVRAFYLDIQQWSVEDPARWARWAAPCPIPAGIYRQTRASKRRVNERIASRVRERQELLPALVERVESERDRAGRTAHGGSLGSARGDIRVPGTQLPAHRHRLRPGAGGARRPPGPCDRRRVG